MTEKEKEEMREQVMGAARELTELLPTIEPEELSEELVKALLEINDLCDEVLGKKD